MAHDSDKKIPEMTFSRFLSIFKNRIMTGVLVVIPVFISLWVTWFIYAKLTEWSVLYFEHNNWFSNWCSPAVSQHLIRISALLFLLFLLFMIGTLTHLALGKRILQLAQNLLLRLPIVNFIYSTCKQIGDAIWSSKAGGMFHQVVLIEYPRKDCWVIGFMTNDNKEAFEVTEKLNDDILSIFVPTTPNPTSGFVYFIPRRDCIFLDMPIADAMRLIVSCGAVTKMDEKLKNKTSRTNQKQLDPESLSPSGTQSDENL